MNDNEPFKSWPSASTAIALMACITILIIHFT